MLPRYTSRTGNFRYSSFVPLPESFKHRPLGGVYAEIPVQFLAKCPEAVKTFANPEDHRVEILIARGHIAQFFDNIIVKINNDNIVVNT